MKFFAVFVPICTEKDISMIFAIPRYFAIFAKTF